MGRHYRLTAIFFSVVLISAPYCEAQSTSLKSWFGSKTGETAGSATQNPPKKSLALRERMGGSRASDKQPILQPARPVGVESVGYDQPVEPLIPEVMVSKVPFVGGGEQPAVLSLVPTDLAAEPTRVYQDANPNSLIPEVIVTTEVPSAVVNHSSAPSAIIPAPLPFMEESKILEASPRGIVAVQPSVPGEGPKPVITQPTMMASSTVVTKSINANPISYSPPVKPVLDSALGIIGGMDSPQSLPLASVANSVAAAPTTAKLTDQVELMPLKPNTTTNNTTTSVASLEPVAGPSTPSLIATGDVPQFVVHAPKRKAERMLSLPIDILPFNKLISTSLAEDTMRTYATDEMVGPLAGAASLVNRLNVENDFRHQAATTINMTRVSADASGMGPEWMQSHYAWVAPTFHHKPLYFEQPNLERYGYGPKPVLQPFASGAHFFTSVAMLPYKMLTQHPYEKTYMLGNNRPGDCVPYQKRTLLGQSYPGEVVKYHEPGSGY